jgi:hypothetical protein
VRRGDRLKENHSGSGSECERGRKRVTEELVIRAESERNGDFFERVRKGERGTVNFRKGERGRKV